MAIFVNINLESHKCVAVALFQDETPPLAQSLLNALSVSIM